MEPTNTNFAREEATLVKRLASPSEGNHPNAKNSKTDTLLVNAEAVDQV
jgi:hypothetical protein